MNVTVMKQVRISAAHHLPNHQGKCANLHGHNYLVQAFKSGEVDLRTGMVVDFYEMGQDLDSVVGVWDHHDLNDCCKNPTAEELACSWLSVLNYRSPGYVKVRVWETDDCYAEASVD